MFGISFEHILIVGVILLIMGPKRLPELGNTMGKAIRNFKDSLAGIEEANFKRINNNNAPVVQNTTPPVANVTPVANATPVAAVSPAATPVSTNPVTEIQPNV